MFEKSMQIEGYDDELWAAIQAEERRQEEHIELIASENYASPRVMEAQGSVLTNKYAEGYPRQALLRRLRVRRRGRAAGDRPRESTVRRRLRQRAAALRLAGQCRRSTWPCCQPGDTILGMSLAHGGHLTHGAKLNFSGKLYNAVQYGLDAETGEIDYDAGRAPGPRAQAEDDHRRLLRLLAGRRLAAFSRHRRRRSAPTCWSTWRTSPAWSPPASTPTRCRSPTSPPPPRTRPCAARAAASSWPRPIPRSRRSSTRWCSPAPRAAR